MFIKQIYLKIKILVLMEIMKYHLCLMLL